MSSERRRWQLVLEVPGDTARTFTVGSQQDADRVIDSVRAVLRVLMQKGGCRSLVIGVHVEGADCDHQLSGGGT